MTVSSTTVKNSYSGNGSTTQFAYGYKIFADSDLIVIIRVNSTGAETVKSLGTHYNVSGAGDASGGNVTFTSGNVPASGQTVVIIREVPQTQAIDYIANDPFPAESHEEGLDRATMTTQQVQEELNRSLKISRTNTMTSTEFTVGATDRANKILSFDSSGELAVTQELGTFKGTDATTTTAAYVVRDIVKSTTTAQLNNIYICIQASPVGTALTNTSYWTLIVDAVSAATSATAAAASATTAGNCATASASSATTSGNCATLSGNCATASSNSATASANSATAAEAAFDSFDDRYLGAKGSAPSTDNDGNALLTGALYFNSSSNQIFNWTGSAWEAIKPSSSEQTNINALGASAVVADMAILATTDVVNDMNILATTDVVADMNTLGTSDVVTDMNTLGTADVVSDMNTLASSATVSAMNLLGTSAVVEDMGILATTDVVADMAILATSDIVTDMNVLGTSANVSAMGVLGTSANVTNMATVCANIAGVNSFAERYRVGSSNPTSDLNEGDLFYNTTSNVVLFYNGSAWVTIVAGNVTQTGSETLTNKTLTAPVISGSSSSAGTILFKEDTDNGTNAITLKGAASTADVTLTLPSATDTLVGKNTTDTLTNKTINASQLVDASIATGKLADDSVTYAKMQDTSTANRVLGAVSAGTIGEVQIATDMVADNAINLAKMASGTDGNIISYDASGNPVAVATGNSGQVLTSAGAGSPPVFADAAGGGVTFKEGGTNFTRSLLVGDDSTGTLSSATDNTGVGTNVFSALTSGTSNVAVGSFAMCANTTGEDNTAIGKNALCTNTTGNSNIAIGKNSLYSNTTSDGNNNVALGIQSLYCNTTGPRNVAVGTQALYKNVTGEDLVAVGYQALYCNTSRCSVAFGRNALKFNTSGMENTALGHIASEKNTTGEANVSVGTCALYKNTASSFNTAIGALSTFCSTSGNCNTAVGWCSSATITTGDNNIAIGYLAGTDAVRNVTTGSNNIVLGNNNSATAHIKIDWTVTSDLRDKTEIKNVPYGLDFVNQITPIEYKFKKSREDNTPTGNKKYGFKAQEILALEGDDSVIVNNDDEENLKLTNAHLIPVLVNAIKELKAEIDELKKK